MVNKYLDNFTKEELIALIEDYSKNWLAMDGLWFQNAEKNHGMDTAMKYDEDVWANFTVIEAKRIKKFAGLDEHPGLDGLEQAMRLRLYANINQESYTRPEPNKLVYKTLDCRVQSARSRKGMEWHPCKSVGIIEFGGFARTIDDRITCKCLSCYPDINDGGCCCSWEFTLNE